MLEVCCGAGEGAGDSEGCMNIVTLPAKRKSITPEMVIIVFRDCMRFSPEFVGFSADYITQSHELTHIYHTPKITIIHT